MTSSAPLRVPDHPVGEREGGAGVAVVEDLERAAPRPRCTSCMRSSSARSRRSAMGRAVVGIGHSLRARPVRISVSAAASVERRAAPRAPTSRSAAARGQVPDARSRGRLGARRLWRLPLRTRSTTRPAPAPAPTTPRRRADRGARPVARVAHRRQLPGLELVGGQLGELDERALEPRAELLGRLDRRSAARRQASMSTSCSLHLSPSRLEPSSTISSSCLMARWISTLVAPSVRPSARAISRLSMPSAKRMISASRRSSGQLLHALEDLASAPRGPRPAPRSCAAPQITPASSMRVCGRRERSR